MSPYWALVHQGEEGYGISFPDVPGCISAADTLEDVLAEGRDALSSHLALMRSDGDPLPRARSHAELTADPDSDWSDPEAAWHQVQPREVAAPRMRVNVMVDAALLRETDRAAEASGKTRSGLIEDALREHFGLATTRFDGPKNRRVRTAAGGR